MTDDGRPDVDPAVPRRISGRTSIVLALFLMAMTVALGGMAVANIGHAQERALMKAISFRVAVNGDNLILLTQWITWFGDSAQRTLAMVLFAAWLFWRKRPYAALVMLVVPPMAGATSSILKEIFGRARPDVVPHLDVVTSLSFPSGHATNVMATCLLAALLVPERAKLAWFVLAFLAAAAIGASRVLLGVHWPSDVVAGWCWGAAIALLGLAIARRLEADLARPAHENPLAGA